MREAFFKFLIRLTIFSLILVAITWAVFQFGLPQYYIQIVPLVFLFYFIVTIGFHYMLMRIAELRPARFVNNFMLFTTLKLFIYTAFIVIYLVIDKTKAVPFTIFFLSLYMLYTIFEVSSILSHIRKEK